MSLERHPHFESNKTREKGAEFNIAKEVKENLKKLEQKENNPSEHSIESATETIRETIEAEARPAEQLRQKERPAEEASDHHSINAHAKLKIEAYRKLLTDVQAKLSPRDQRFSNFVHKPFVESVSEIASKTIARPVGIAWGSIITFLGVVISLFYAYRYGIPFNYLLFVLLFMAGYLTATILELAFKLLARYKS